MQKKDEEGLFGNDRFEGFCVDLLKEIAEDLRFKYSFFVVKDGKYGASEEGIGWTGMVRELIDNVRLRQLQCCRRFSFTVINTREKRQSKST